MSDLSAAQQAILRAKAVAARLSGQTWVASPPTDHPEGSISTDSTTIITTEAATETDTNGSSSGGGGGGSSGKRKRWGVAPPETVRPAAAAAAILPTRTEITTSKRPKTATATKRVWISQTSTELPPAHFVQYLVPRIRDYLAQQPPPQATSGGEDDDDGASTGLDIKLHGRGSPSTPPPPGMPEEPLHIVVQGPSTWTVEQAVQILEQWIDQAEQEPVDPDLIEREKQAEAAVANLTSSALVVQQANSSSRTTTYRPASVAQLIGQANMSPEQLAALANTDFSFSEQVPVPNGIVGFIIGRGGETISRIQATTGAKVQIQKEHEVTAGQTHRIITVQAASQESLDHAVGMIQGMVQDRVRAMGGKEAGPSGGTTAGSSGDKKDAKIQEALLAGHYLVTMDVPDADVGLIIGKQGMTIRSIQEQSGASNIQVPPTAHPYRPQVRTVQITHATQEGAQWAQQMIQNLLQSKPSFAQAPPSAASAAPQVTIQVSIPDKDVGLCIGRQGCVIKSMQSATQTRIQIPSHPTPGEAHRIATVTGTAEGCQQVQQMIHRIVQEQSSAFLMGGGGAAMGGAAAASYYYGQPSAAPTMGQGSNEVYSAEWAAYHAAQQAAVAAAAAQQQQPPLYADNIPQAATEPVQQQPQAEQAQPAPNAYYEEFFRYAYYYGEDAARQYYGIWSPPVGTPNPYGVNPQLASNPTGMAPQALPQASEAAPVYQAATHSGTSAVAMAHNVESTAPAMPAEPSASDARETSRRKVSNLPAWMTKG